MKLEKLQVAFKNFIHDQQDVKFVATPSEGLNIHKKNYYDSLTLALNNKFPVTSSYLKQKSRKIFYEFILLNPSRTPNLDEYGENLPEFLNYNVSIIAGELAGIDLIIFKCNASAPENALSADKLAHITPNEFDILKFSLSQSLYLQTVSGQSLKIWCEFKKSIGFDEKGLSSKIANVFHIAIYLSNGHAKISMIPIGYYECLKGLGKNINLLEATGRVLEIDPKFDLNQFLTFCFKNNLITNYSLSA